MNELRAKFAGMARREQILLGAAVLAILLFAVWFVLVRPPARPAGETPSAVAVEPAPPVSAQPQPGQPVVTPDSGETSRRGGVAPINVASGSGSGGGSGSEAGESVSEIPVPRMSAAVAEAAPTLDAASKAFSVCFASRGGTSAECAAKLPRGISIVEASGTIRLSLTAPDGHVLGVILNGGTPCRILDGDTAVCTAWGV